MHLHMNAQNTYLDIDRQADRHMKLQSGDNSGKSHGKPWGLRIVQQTQEPEMMDTSNPGYFLAVKAGMRILIMSGEPRENHIKLLLSMCPPVTRTHQ